VPASGGGGGGEHGAAGDTHAATAIGQVLEGTKMTEAQIVRTTHEPPCPPPTNLLLHWLHKVGRVVGVSHASLMSACCVGGCLASRHRIDGGGP
jgi:hypothetical protein